MVNDPVLSLIAQKVMRKLGKNVVLDVQICNAGALGRWVNIANQKMVDKQWYLGCEQS